MNKIKAIILLTDDEVLKVYTSQDDIEKGLEMRVNNFILSDSICAEMYVITNIEDYKSVRLVTLERG